MSGLYNMLMGRNPHGPYLMGILGFVKNAPQNAWLGRFRDVYTNDAADRIFMLHRNYPDGDEFNQAIKQHPNFVKYTPEENDETYGIWEFTVPEEFAHIVKEIASLSDNTPLMQRYKELIENMGKGLDNEATRNAMEVGKKILAPIIEQMKGESTQEVSHGDGTVVIEQMKGESTQEVSHGDGTVVVHSFKKGVE